MCRGGEGHPTIRLLWHFVLSTALLTSRDLDGSQSNSQSQLSGKGSFCLVFKMCEVFQSLVPLRDQCQFYPLRPVFSCIPFFSLVLSKNSVIFLFQLSIQRKIMEAVDSPDQKHLLYLKLLPLDVSVQQHISAFTSEIHYLLTLQIHKKSYNQPKESLPIFSLTWLF